MVMVQTGWVPKKRNVRYEPKPEGIPDWVYSQAVTAKRHYNEDWEMWVYMVAQRDNVPLHVAEDACIRGIKKEILRYRHVWGDAIGEWFERYLDMSDIFSKVKHPEYQKKLG